MLNKIKNSIEQELKVYIRSLDQAYSLSKISPILFRSIREFLLRKGKRIRPSLFVLGYLGFAKKSARGLYRSAISLELLHDFMLVHDDIIDRSETRRGKPSMHTMLNRYLAGYKNIKFNGEDLTIVAGDVMYAMALHSFLAIKENFQRKEEALKKLIEAALYTGSGEFIELLLGLKKIEQTTKKDIYKIYDLKTANYTFASPLSIGAILGGARKTEVNKLFGFGICVGRAFQIKDDITGMFSTEKETGKANLSDLREAKKTILIWKAYNNSGKTTKEMIKKILNKNSITRSDLLKMRKIIAQTKALEYAKKEVFRLLNQSQDILASSKMHKTCKKQLANFSHKILSL